MNTTNGVGWEVQELTADGWVNCIRRESDGQEFLFVRKVEAIEFADAMAKVDGREYRVYESLK